MLALLTLIPLFLALASPTATGWGQESSDEYPRREIVEKTYVEDPWQIDISGMPSLDEMPVDDRCDGIDWQKITLPDPCVDGSGTDTFIMVSKGSSDNVLVYLEGGGSGTDWITSNVMTATLDTNPTLSEVMSSIGIFNTFVDKNPFKDWTIIYVPYGTGDLHVGNRVMEYTSIFGLTQTVYHTGYVNTTTVLRWTAAQQNEIGGGFNEVCFAGSSAGGAGVVTNFLTAHELFEDEDLTLISDAGPAINSEQNPDFTMKTTNYCWGYSNHLPEDAREYVREKGEPTYIIDWALSQDEYDGIDFGMMEDLKDMMYAPVFLWYTPHIRKSY